MAKNQLVTTLTPEIEAAFAPQVIEVIRTSLCPTATDAEFLLFAHKAASYGLDPFKNEIFFIKYGQQARIQFAAEAYLSKARSKEGFQPPDTQMVCANDEFKVEKDPETKELVVVQHDIGFPRGEIVGAYSIAYRDDKRPVTVLMDRAEIQHMFNGQNKENWNKWTSDMFGKHVEQRALKKQYGLEFGDEASRLQPDSSERVDVTPTTEPEVVQPTGQPDPKPTEAAEGSEEIRMKQAKAEMSKKFGQLGITDRAEMAAYIAEKARPKGDKPNLREMTGLLKIMDLEIQQRAAAQANDDDLPM